MDTLSHGSENFLEKGRRERVAPINPNLVLVHIVDKNGHHTVRWKRRDELESEKKRLGHKHVSEVKEGDVLYYKGKKHKFKKIWSEHYIQVHDDTGKKVVRSLNKVKFVHPVNGDEDREPNVPARHYIPYGQDADTSSSGERSAANERSSRRGRSEVEEQSEDTVDQESAEDTVDDEEDSEVYYDDEPLDYEIYGTPDERLDDWKIKINRFAKYSGKYLHNITIAYGTGGIGKTYNVLQDAN
ncbi:MAG: hypothetical protein NZ529_03540, partial [Cytophagaceae bacterium]|nr:hypothetical protein [Cytophagaceae bacterium]MDW8455843.1 hypothetical protein [Cytophagaceae bacterium]